MHKGERNSRETRGAKRKRSPQGWTYTETGELGRKPYKDGAVSPNQAHPKPTRETARALLAGSNQTTAADAMEHCKPTLGKGHDQGRNNKQ